MFLITKYEDSSIVNSTSESSNLNLNSFQRDSRTSVTFFYEVSVEKKGKQAANLTS